MSSLVEKFGIMRVRGWKSWVMWGSMFVMMFMDQFVCNVPFANIVFPMLVLAGVILHPMQAILLSTVFGVVFELYGCFGYYGPTTVIPWTIEVVVGFTLPVLLSFAFRKKASIVALTLVASLGELLYFWTSVVATVLIWKVPFVPYFLSDIPFELYGCLATAGCSLLMYSGIYICCKSSEKSLLPAAC